MTNIIKMAGLILAVLSGTASAAEWRVQLQPVGFQGQCSRGDKVTLTGSVDGMGAGYSMLTLDPAKQAIKAVYKEKYPSGDVEIAYCAVPAAKQKLTVYGRYARQLSCGAQPCKKGAAVKLLGEVEGMGAGYQMQSLSPEDVASATFVEKNFSGDIEIQYTPAANCTPDKKLVVFGREAGKLSCSK